MNKNAKEIAEYFRENHEYKKLLKGIKSKYINLGEVKGNVIINNPDKAEKQALSGLMKKDFSKNKSISINLKKLQERIDESKFAGANIKEIIDEYFKEEILTKKENKKSYETELLKFFEEILTQNKGTTIYKYIKQIITSKNEIYYNLKKYYNKDKLYLKVSLINACKGINNLPRKKTRIPVFAINITGNPHEFDRNTLSGKIFIMLMCYIKNIRVPKSTENLAEVYYNNNLLIDDVSNMVLCKNVQGFIRNETVENIQHEGLRGFAIYNEPIYLSLYNLSNIVSLYRSHKYNEVLVMENPTVFMEVSRRCSKDDFPLVCTYGQVKLSGLILLDMFAKSKYKIYYSGDIDPEGIQIADKLKQRYNDNLDFFGFDVNTYKRNFSKVKVSESRLKKLDSIKSVDLQHICYELRMFQKACYEEENIERIVDFINGL